MKKFLVDGTEVLVLPDRETLLSFIDYCPESGVCRRKQSAPNAPRGSIISPRRYVKIGGKMFVLARVIWKIQTGVDPDKLIDHKDRDHTNNRWTNLREASRADNNRNVGVRSDNTSGLTGISRYRFDPRFWCAEIQKDRTRHTSPLFNTVEEAVAWREDMANKLHGEFAQHKGESTC